MTPTDYRYTGQREEAELGLYYYVARWYDPALGRFTQADTIVAQPWNPQSYNRYSYVNNNPTNYTDSTGHCIDGITTWACIAGVIALVTKVIDYGMTAYDLAKASAVLADPNSTSVEVVMAGLEIELSIIFEALEPDELLPIGLPADDYLRRKMLREAKEALAEGGEEGLEKYLRGELGDKADEVLDAIGIFCSFSKETLVATKDGQKPISEIKVGDYVMAYNEETGEIDYFPVTAIWAHEDDAIVYLVIDGELIITTPDHPFYTIKEEWVSVSALIAGDEVMQSNGEYGLVESNTTITQTDWMYNLTVDTAHTYFVGDGQWLVHNDCGVDPNKLNHIFGKPGRDMDDLLKMFDNNQEEAFLAVQEAFTEVAGDYSIDVLQETGIPVVVNGVDLIVRGTIVDGVPMIGTFWRP